jgi:CheY-like chemotaxis protein
VSADVSECPKIVVIENDPNIRMVVRSLLESEGYTVEAYEDGRVALERLRQSPETCLILLDLLMPAMSGWEFMAEFLKLPVTVVPIPVYLFSVTREVPGEATAMGAQGFIKKPVNLETLIQIVNDHCRHARKAA